MRVVDRTNGGYMADVTSVSIRDRCATKATNDAESSTTVVPYLCTSGSCGNQQFIPPAIMPAVASSAWLDVFKVDSASVSFRGEYNGNALLPN